MYDNLPNPGAPVAEKAARPKHVPKALEELQEALNEAEKRVDDIIQRISPVLRQEPPNPTQPGGGRAERAATGTDLADAILDRTDQVRSICRRLNRTAQQIEL